MSRMSNLVLEIQEFVEPLIYMGATDKTIMEQFEILFKGHSNYSYIKREVEIRVRNRDFYANVYI